MQPPLPLGVEPWRLPAQERGRYEQQFPDAVPVRRLLVRNLSTHGSVRAIVPLFETEVRSIAALDRDADALFAHAPVAAR